MQNPEVVFDVTPKVVTGESLAVTPGPMMPFEIQYGTWPGTTGEPDE